MKAFDKFRSQVFVGDRVVCIWPVKNQYGIDVLKHGTECTVEALVQCGSRDEYYLKLKDAKCSLGFDVELPKKPTYSGRRFMVTGQTDLVGMIKDL